MASKIGVVVAVLVGLVVLVAVLGYAFQSAPTPDSEKVFTNETWPIDGGSNVYPAMRAFSTIIGATSTGVSAKLQALNAARNGDYDVHTKVVCGASVVHEKFTVHRITSTRTWFTYILISGSYVPTDSCVFSLTVQFLPGRSPAGCENTQQNQGTPCVAWIGKKQSSTDVDGPVFVAWGVPSGTTPGPLPPGVTENEDAEGDGRDEEPCPPGFEEDASGACVPVSGGTDVKILAVAGLAVLVLVVVAVLVARRRGT